MKATVTDLRRHTRKIREALERGETVDLYYRGRLKAHIKPVAEQTTREGLMKSPVFGMWKDREDMADVAAYVRKLRAPRYPELWAGLRKSKRK